MVRLIRRQNGSIRSPDRSPGFHIPQQRREHSDRSASLAALMLGALGVVFGDIGTSPLYTLKECLIAAGGAKATVADLYGIVSLMLWALVMAVTVKYPAS